MTEEKFLDLVGTSCPMNFVRIKLCLSKLLPGAVIRVRVDGGAVALDLKRSLEDQGYEVLSFEQEANSTVMLVRKV